MNIRRRAWTALLLPPVAWFVFQQGLSALLHADCTRAGAGMIWGLASLACCALAAWIGWSLRAHRGGLVDPWLAWLALFGAGIFALAILFQTLAILIVPACAA